MLHPLHAILVRMGYTSRYHFLFLAEDPLLPPPPSPLNLSIVGALSFAYVPFQIQMQCPLSIHRWVPSSSNTMLMSSSMTVLV